MKKKKQHSVSLSDSIVRYFKLKYGISAVLFRVFDVRNLGGDEIFDS